MVTISQRLEKLRMDKGISRIQLASLLGLPKMSVEKFETGRLTPTKEQQEKLASYFGVSVAYLKGESDDPQNMESWLNGNIREEPEPVVTAAKPVKTKESVPAEGAIFNQMLKSEAFKAAVLEVLRTPEGQKLLSQAIRTEMLNKR